MKFLGFPGGMVNKNLPAKTGDIGLIPDPGRSHMPWNNQAGEPQLFSLCSGAQEPQPLKQVQFREFRVSAPKLEKPTR